MADGADIRICQAGQFVVRGTLTEKRKNMANAQVAAREREAKRTAEQALQLPQLKDALGKLTYQQLAREDEVWASVVKLFPAVRFSAFHDAYIVALDAADVAEQARQKQAQQPQPLNSVPSNVSTGGEVTSNVAATTYVTPSPPDGFLSVNSDGNGDDDTDE